MQVSYEGILEPTWGQERLGLSRSFSCSSISEAPFQLHIYEVTHLVILVRVSERRMVYQYRENAVTIQPRSVSAAEFYVVPAASGLHRPDQLTRTLASPTHFVRDLWPVQRTLFSLLQRSCVYFSCAVRYRIAIDVVGTITTCPPSVQK